MSVIDRDALKREAATYAARFIEPNSLIGLGTGSTAIHAVREIARRYAADELPGIQCFATSSEIARAATDAGLPILPPDTISNIALTIDGADEVDPSLNLIKGGGGALFHEKVIAQSTCREIIVVDDAKMSPKLGTLHALPVEVIHFGHEANRNFLADLGGNPILRTTSSGTPFLTDEGNLIYDCAFGPIDDIETLAAELDARTGIVEHGLFIDLTHDLIIASPEGLRHLQRDPVSGTIREIPTIA